MPTIAALLTFLIFAVPDLSVRWLDGQNEAMKVSVKGRSEVVDKCVKSGLKARYRFEAKLCRRGTWWVDRCGETLVETRFMEHDPISDSYLITSDTHGDSIDPVSVHESSFEKARKNVSALSVLHLDQLKNGAKLDPPEAKRYVSIRALSECEDEYNSVLAGIPYILTLGLVKFGQYDSGWIDFEVKKK